MNAAEISLPGVDIAALLAPIDKSNPSGQDLRRLPKSVYLEIEGFLEGKAVPEILSTDSEGRQISVRDQSALRRSISEGLKRSLTCLARESKDLEIAAFCVRGLLLVHGYQGLGCGLYVMRELHERFWDTLHPNPPGQVTTHDDYGDALPQPIPEHPHLTERRILLARGGAVEKMEHAVRSMLKLATLFVADDGVPCRVADWDSAKAPDAERSTEKLNALAASQPAELFEQLEQAFDCCIDECTLFGQVLAHRYARQASAELGIAELEAPSLGSLEKELKDFRSFLSELRTGPGNKPNAAVQKDRPAARNELAAGRLPAAFRVTSNGRYQPKDRAEALSMLLAAGQLLQRNEPLSPLPRLLFRLLQWARADSLRPWLDDMFRSSESEQELVLMQLGLDSENKLASERLPSSCPTPRDRMDALEMLRDVACALHSHEPLSPLPYHLERLLALASGTPQQWLASVFGAESATLARIHRALGFTGEPLSESKSTEN